MIFSYVNDIVGKNPADFLINCWRNFVYNSNSNSNFNIVYNHASFIVFSSELYPQ